MLRNAPPATVAERTRNSRRVTPCSVGLAMACLLDDLRGALDGADDARIGGAAAQVAVHARDDLLIARRGVLRQQGGGLHDLAGLAVPALRDLQFDPGSLDRMRVARIEALDGGDGGVADVAERDRTGPHCLSVDVDGAGPALGDAAAELGSGEPQLLADHPEQGCVGWGVREVTLTVDGQV